MDISENNGKISYDYELLINEIQDEIDDNWLKQDDIIYIYKKPMTANSKSFVRVVDWFYGDENRITRTDYEELDEQDINLLLLRKEKYLELKNQLTPIVVKDLLMQLKKINRII